MKETLNDTMNGKICLVTGATNGIGKATAQALAQMGATVVIVGRNPAKCAAVVSEIKHSSTHRRSIDHGRGPARSRSVQGKIPEVACAGQ